MAQVTELITKFSFFGSIAPLTGFNSSLNKGIGLLAGFVVATAGVSIALSKWASGVLQAEQPLINLSSQTGIAVEAIQELGFAASVSNSSAESLSSTLAGLSSKIGDAAQKGSADFSRLGISVRDANGNIKTADKVLLEVGQRMKQLNLSLSEQQSFAQALGIDPSLITLLGKSSSEIKKLRIEAQENGLLTKEQAKQAEIYNDSLTRMNASIESVKRLVSVGLAPGMTDLSNKFKDLINKNKDWIINGIDKTVTVIGNLFKALGRLAPFLGVVAAAFVAAKIATLGFSGAIALLLSPAILIAAGIAAILLVVDDLIVAFDGGKSVIRDFFLEFFGFDIVPEMKKIVEGFGIVFDQLIELGQDWLVAVGGIFSGIGNLLSGNFEQAWIDIKTSFEVLINSLGTFFQNVFGGVFDWMKNAIIDILPQWALDLIGEETSDPASQAATIDQSVLPGGSQSQSLQNRNVNQDVEINIRTNDPERAGRAAADSLQRQMEDAQTQANRGGF